MPMLLVLVTLKEGQMGWESKNKQELDYLLILPLVFHAALHWYPLLHLTKLVLHLSVQVEQAGPQRACLLRVLQVQGGGHDPQRLEQAGLDMSQRYLGFSWVTREYFELLLLLCTLNYILLCISYTKRMI